MIEQLTKVHGFSEVHVVKTLPTASLTRRAVALHEAIAATATPGDRLHLVGHSSGGLDARLWATPGVVLPGVDPEAFVDQLASVITVSTPHRGTPSAEVFHTVAGKRLLRVISLVTILVIRRGGVPLRAALSIGDLLVEADQRLGASPDLLDNLFDGLLGELSDDGRGQVAAFFESVGADQSLLSQLVPAAMDVFDATTADRDGVRYGSVASRSEAPRIRNALAAGLSPGAQGGYVWYTLCYKLASGFQPTRMPSGQAADVLRRRWPDLEPGDNDGMVPTLSQPHGELIRAVGGDHLDVLGHFGDPDLLPISYDWFNTGTGFDRQNFEALWTDVAHFIQA